MTKIGDSSFQVEVASDAIIGVLRGKSTAEVEALLAKGEVVTNLARLHFVLDRLDVYSPTSAGDIAPAVAGRVLAQLGKPQEYIELLARILKLDPKALANQVAGRLSSGVFVGKGELAARAAPSAPVRALTADELVAMKTIAQDLKKLGLTDAAAKAREFITRYTKITKAPVIFEQQSIPNLYKTHGQHVLGYLQNEVRLSVLPNHPPQELLERFRPLMLSVFAELERKGVAADTSVMAGFANEGVTQALFQALDLHQQISRVGVADATVVDSEPVHLDRGTIFGTKAADSEPLFDDLSAGNMLIVVSPDDADKKRLLQHAKRGGVAIVLKGGNVADPTLDVPGVIQLFLDTPPAVNAQVAVDYVLAKTKERSQQSYVSLAEFLAIGDAPAEINEVRQWARKVSAAFRIVRLQNQALDKVIAANPDASAGELSAWMLELGKNVASYTHGIDNFKNNGEWKKKATEAVKACAGPVASLVDQLGVDILFASWFGIQEMDKPPSYFEENVADLEFPAELDALSSNPEHTFDKDKYADVRLGFAPQFLNARDSRPEVFLGSREEMMLFYRARGYEYDVQAHETNGTRFEVFRSIDAAKPAVVVIHGIDSESRMLQVAALMRVAGVDPRRCLVRGTIDRVRDVNASLLEARLMEITSSGDRRLDIAGVVVGNRQECFSAIAEAAGVEVDKLEIQNFPAGPFEVRAVKVKMAGSPPDAPPSLFLAFKPAYGELTQDLGKVIRRATSHQKELLVLGGGVGGALDPKEKVGAAHFCTTFVSGDKVYALDGGGPPDAVRPEHISLLRLDGVDAPDAVNIFSPTPLEQTTAWLAKTQQALAKFGKAPNTDQEGAQLIEGLAYDDPRRPAGDCKYVVCPILVQSDVVGSGGIAASTTTKACSETIQTVAKAFAVQGGIGQVAVGNGEFATLSGAVERGEAAAGVGAARPSFGAAGINKVLPDFSPMIADWLSSAEQLKGQKASFRMVAETFGAEEEEFLQLLFTGTNPADLWVTVDAADRNNEKIREAGKSYDGIAAGGAQNSRRLREFARRFRFENIVLALQNEMPTIRGSADIILAYDKERASDTDPKPGKLDIAERLGADGNGDSDVNYSLSHTLVLGAVAPPQKVHDDLPFEVTDELVERFTDILDQVHEAVGGQEKSPDKKAKLLREKREELVMPLLIERCRDELYELGGGGDAEVAAANTRVLYDIAIERAQANHYVYTGGLDRAAKVSLVGRLRRELNMAFDGGVRMFADGLTHRFPGLKRAITDRANAWLKAGTLTPLPARTGEKAVATPRFYALDNLESFFRVAGTDTYRKPHWICGPSRESWDNLTRESRIALHIGVEVLAKLAAGEKDRIAPVTGGTKYGYEELVHEIFTREGWHILGTLTQNSEVSAEKWEPDERLRHFTFTGVNWFGVARLVAEYIILRYGGKATNIAGGGIAKQQAALQQAMNVEAYMMTGLPASPKGLRVLTATLQKAANKAHKAAGGTGDAPPVQLTEEQKRWAAGASIEMGERYPGRAFDTFDQLCEQFGVTAQLEAAKQAAGITGPIHTLDIAALAISMGIDVKAIADRHPPDT